jgi:hypothetical protein
VFNNSDIGGVEVTGRAQQEAQSNHLHHVREVMVDENTCIAKNTEPSLTYLLTEVLSKKYMLLLLGIFVQGC